MDIDIKNNVKKFIESNFLVEFDDTVDEGANLFRSGFVDSFGFLELVSFLEKTFQIKILNEELVSDDLVSVSNITACISRKIDEKSASN